MLPAILGLLLGAVAAEGQHESSRAGLDSTQIRFEKAAVLSFSEQDSDGTFAVDPEHHGQSLTLTGNSWKRVSIDVQLFADSVLEFDVRIRERGEIQGIGFSNNNQADAAESFQLFGTQSWAYRGSLSKYAYSAGDERSATGAWMRYRIPVGETLSGAYQYLTFINDDDVSGSQAEIQFANLQLYRTVDPGRAAKTTTVSSRTAFNTAVKAARPGDTVLVAPGDYRGPIYFSNVRGAHGRPVTIAAADPSRRPRFTGSGSGSTLQFSRISHLRLKNLDIVGTASNGLNIDDGGASNPPSTDIELENLLVADIGSGNRDGIKLSGVDRLRISGGTIRQWGTGGSAIDMVGVHDALIENMVIRHNSNSDSGTVYGNGIQAKGASKRIWIRGNRFEHAGARAVQIGGRTGSSFFRVEGGGSPTTEASEVTVEK